MCSFAALRPRFSGMVLGGVSAKRFCFLKPHDVCIWTLLYTNMCLRYPINRNMLNQTLRVHVLIYYIHWPQSTQIGTTLRPYILFGYLDP